MGTWPGPVVMACATRWRCGSARPRLWRRDAVLSSPRFPRYRGALTVSGSIDTEGPLRDGRCLEGALRGVSSVEIGGDQLGDRFHGRFCPVTIGADDDFVAVTGGERHEVEHAAGGNGVTACFGDLDRDRLRR